MTKSQLLATPTNQIDISIVFNRHATSPTIPNKIANAKEYLSINAPLYFNSIHFVGGANTSEQGQSVSRFQVYTNTPQDVKAYFVALFKGLDVYTSINHALPTLEG